MKKRAAVLFLAVVLAVTLCPPALAAQPYPFPDVAEDHWSYTYVLDLYKQGVLGGYPDGRFHPRDTLTWGQSFKLILGAIGEEEIPEREPGQHWAYPYIEPAIDNRLVYSFNEEFLDEAPTRRDVARMVARALDLTDISGESPYTDCDDGYVVELYEKSIMWGTAQPDGTRTFSPDEPIAREEMAAIIWRMMHTDVSEGMFRHSNYWLDALDTVPAISFSGEQFSKDEQGRVTYSGGYYTHGIDVSGHQKEIDWQAVAADGIDFAIIRAGNRLYGKDSSGAVCEDSWFDTYMQGAISAGLDVGAYFFSNAITVEEAIEEADLLISKLEPYREYVTYPVVCDWEFLGGAKSRAYGVDARIITQCVDAFCRRVAEAGYQPMFYFNDYCGYVKMDLSKLTQYPFWYAEYASTPHFRYDFQMWQYSSKGKVAGINTEVDMDLCFVPYGGGAQRPDTAPEYPLESEPTSYLPTEPMVP
ncbi:MAG: S-layer homology domain-containing protein [Oscillospiraceae bacterium]|nr:S-layer homology domain-containing protein [Oscillospiraceae bacterium]